MYSQDRSSSRAHFVPRDWKFDRIPPDRPPVLRLHSGSVVSGQNEWRLPVMPETILLAELALHEVTVDLELFAQIILRDLGATLRILRLVGMEYEEAGERPYRIAECIVFLGLQTCIEALRAGPMLREFRAERRRRIVQWWHRSRTVAEQARRLADQSGRIDLEQMYLVALCHGVGALPGIFGWTGARRAVSNTAGAGAELARAWSLPACVLEYFSKLQIHGGSSPWLEIIRSAQRRLSEQTDVNADAQEPSLGRLHAV